MTRRRLACTRHRGRYRACQVVPFLPPERPAAYLTGLAVSAMQGSVLASVRRRDPLAPVDALTDAVAGMIYGWLSGHTDDRVSNALASWMFVVGYWAGHQQDPTTATTRAVAALKADGAL